MRPCHESRAPKEPKVMRFFQTKFMKNLGKKVDDSLDREFGSAGDRRMASYGNFWIRRKKK